MTRSRTIQLTEHKSNKLREHSAEEAFVDFVQTKFYDKSNKLREHSAEEAFVDFVQKGFY